VIRNPSSARPKDGGRPFHPHAGSNASKDVRQAQGSCAAHTRTPRTILSILYKETRAGDDRLTLARRSLKIFDATLEALTLLLVEIAPMRPPPHSCILKMRQHSLSVLAGIDHS
jgi:hypothetical protein